MANVRAEQRGNVLRMGSDLQRSLKKINAQASQPEFIQEVRELLGLLNADVYGVQQSDSYSRTWNLHVQKHTVIPVEAGVNIKRIVGDDVQEIVLNTATNELTIRTEQQESSSRELDDEEIRELLRLFGQVAQALNDYFSEKNTQEEQK